LTSLSVEAIQFNLISVSFRFALSALIPAGGVASFTSITISVDGLLSVFKNVIPLIVYL
jgi:hypothetical protein